MNFSAGLQKLIDASLADGKLSEKEKQVLSKKAAGEGINSDEFEIYLESLNKTRKNVKRKQLKDKLISFFKTETGKMVGIAGLMMLIFIPLSVSKSCSSSSYKEKISSTSENMINLIDNYNFQKARELAAHLDQLKNNKEITDKEFKELEHNIALLHNRLYTAEVDFYLNNDEYQMAVNSISELYTSCISRTLINKKKERSLWDGTYPTVSSEIIIRRFYIPAAKRIISKLKQDNHSDMADSYINSIPNSKVRNLLKED